MDRVLIAVLTLGLMGSTPVPLVELAERHCPQFGVSPELALRIMRVESACQPYALGVQIGRVHHGFFPRDPAVASVMLEQALAKTANVGIGVMQINWRTWRQALGLSQEDLLDPETNVLVGCGLLGRHLEGTGSLIQKIGRYHSTTPELGGSYSKRVMEATPCSD